jgi:hypothetical protein
MELVARVTHPQGHVLPVCATCFAAMCRGRGCPFPYYMELAPLGEDECTGTPCTAQREAEEERA